MNYIIIIYFLLLINMSILFLIGEKFLRLIKIISFVISNTIFVVSLLLWINFDNVEISFQNIIYENWNFLWNIYFCLAIDGLSLLFVVLTCFLIPFCILYSWFQFSYCFKELFVLLFIIQFLLLNFFLVTDFFLFFVFFESILIPMFLLIGNYGSRQRKIHASFQFFFYTLFGSFFMIIAIILIYIHEGSSDFTIYRNACFSIKTQLFLWFCFFLSLSIKIPLFPVHLWLPEAHVEAPTVGSVILAGVLLKMGSYGFLRFLLPVFSFANYFYIPLIFVLCFLSIYYVSIITLCQIDLKKLIAYSSISHMGYITIALFSLNLQGIQGSIFLMISHGLVSSLLFFLVGMLYDRYKTRVVFFYKSLYSFMPLFNFFFFIASLANIGFPGTMSFIGEFLMLYSFLIINKIVFVCCCLGFITSIFYSFWLYNKINFLIPYHIFHFGDLTKREFFISLLFVILIFYFGFFPNILLTTFENNVLFLICNNKNL